MQFPLAQRRLLPAAQSPLVRWRLLPAVQFPPALKGAAVCIRFLFLLCLLPVFPEELSSADGHQFLFFLLFPAKVFLKFPASFFPEVHSLPLDIFLLFFQDFLLILPKVLPSAVKQPVAQLHQFPSF